METPVPFRATSCRGAGLGDGPRIQNESVWTIPLGREYVVMTCKCARYALVSFGGVGRLAINSKMSATIARTPAV